MEYLESQTVQELTLRQQTAHRLQSPSGLALDVLRDVIELWNGLWSISCHVLFHLLDNFNTFLASIFVE